VAQAVEHLLCKHKALSSNPVLPKNKFKKYLNTVEKLDIKTR
jgi:hypothetical protein